MGTNCAPLLADLFLYSYESEFRQKLVKDKKIHEARAFNFTYRYIDDVLSINNGIKGQTLFKSDTKLSGPGNSILNVLWKFQCMLESQDKFSVQDIYVVKRLTKPLLGRPAIRALSIISNVHLSRYLV
jgi:hypothetical protein